MNNDEYTPARLYTTVIGATLLIVGIVGFFANSTFSANEHQHSNLIIFSVNGWHNVVHIASGLVGLALITRGPRLFALGFGAVYLVVTIWGFAVGSGHSILSIIPVNTADNILHLAIGVAGIAAGLATRTDGAPARTAGARSAAA